MSDYIRLQEMEFYGYHGALAAEKELGQRFTVNLTLKLDLKEAGLSDELEKTINYAEVYEVVKEVLIGPSYDLIEAVAEEIAGRLLNKYQILESLVVLIKKPEVPIAGVLKNVEVEIERCAQDCK